MKTTCFLLLLVSLTFCLNANAQFSSDVAVFATEKSQGSLSVGGKNAYTKSFSVSILNISEKVVDLSKLCLKAYSPEFSDIKLDTVDEKLISGVLEKGKQVSGLAVFASESNGVLGSALITISEDCI